jgi:hypothetical protein
MIYIAMQVVFFINILKYLFMHDTCDNFENNFGNSKKLLRFVFLSKWFKNTSESANCLFYFYLIYTQSYITFEHFKFAN